MQALERSACRAWIIVLAFSSAVAQKNRFDVTYPRGRYVQWQFLTPPVRSAAELLRYDETTWNVPGSAPVEKQAFHNLTAPFQAAVLGDLQMNEATWDCYINHYSGYSWTELLYAVQMHYSALGYTADSWSSVSRTTPILGNLNWTELNAAQRIAADQLCYFQRVWDGDDIATWSFTSLPTAAPTTMSLFSTPPTNTPSNESVVSFVLPISSPSPIPSPSPTMLQSSSSCTGPLPTIYPTGRLSPTAPPTVMETMAQSDIRLPYLRYSSWNGLNETLRASAARLGYTLDTWNTFSARIEKMSYRSIYVASAGKVIDWDEIITQQMGYTPTQWDCYINHYSDQGWKNLHRIGVQRHFVQLGWNQTRWEEKNSPESRSKHWTDLTDAEQDAATAVCYFQQTWDGDALDNVEAWADFRYMNEGTKSPQSPPTGLFSIPVPRSRYVEWSALQPKIQNDATALAYTESTWNEFSADIEKRSFGEIQGSSGTSDQITRVINMGFSQEQWDCWISHYRGYSWDDLSVQGVQNYFIQLGYTADRWLNDDPPQTVSLAWSNLDDFQRVAAQSLCWFRQTWDGITLTQDAEWGPDFLEMAPSSSSLMHARNKVFRLFFAVTVILLYS
jgi:hypothetical protein